MKRIGAVILNYNDYKRAYNLASILCSFENISKVVVVDNCSMDDSYNNLIAMPPLSKMVILKTEQNGGFAYGNNYGARYLALNNSDLDYTLFINTDIILSESLLKELLKIFEINPKVALVSSRIKGPDGEEQNSCWDFPTFKKICFDNFHFLKIKQKKIVFSERYQKVDVIRGSLMLFKSNILREIDYFDENTFLYGEETIICKKIKDIGYIVNVLTDDYYVHNHIEVVKSQKYLRKLKLIQQSRYYYMKKYFRINIFQKLLLKICDFVGLLEAFFIVLIKSHRKVKS